MHANAFRRTAFRTVFALAAALPSAALALTVEDVVFNHTFEQGLTATLARGAGEPVEVIGGPEVVQGRNGGKAVKLRHGRDAIGFALDGNMNPEAGAVACWLAPGENWGYRNAEGQPVFAGSQVLFHTGDTGAPPRRLVLQTYWRSNLIGMLAYAGGKLTGGWPDGVFQNIFPYPNVTSWPAKEEPREWCHLLFTWREGRLEAYLNGELKKRFERPDLVFGTFGDRFYIGWKKDPNATLDPDDPLAMTRGMVSFDPAFHEPAGRQMDTPWESLVSDVAIFRTNLDASQVRGIYKQGALAYAAQAEAESAGLPENSLLFYASFNAGLAPDVARSAGDATPQTTGKPALVEGKSGQALRVVSRKRQGRKDLSTAVAYPLPGNLRADQGTLAFWISAENWDSGGEVLQILFSTDGPRRFQIQTNPKNRSSLDFQWFTGRYINEQVSGFGRVSTPTILDDTLVEGIERMQPGTWFHMAYVWHDGEIAAFRNGERIAQAAFPRFEDPQTGELGTRFGIGDFPLWSRRFIMDDADLTGRQYGPGFSAGWAPLAEQELATLIDEFAVFDRPLSDVRVARLFKLGVGKFMEAEASGTAAASLTVKPLPTLGRVFFDARHPDAPSGARAVARVTHAEEPGQAREVELATDGQASRGELDTTGLPPGTYAIAFTLTDAQGKDIARNDPGETFALAEPEAWWHNTLGMDDVLHDLVPPPWTPMAVADDTIACWGRSIRFEGRPLPTQIVSAGDELLAAPITLDFSLDGEPLVFGDGRVDYPRVAQAVIDRTWRGESRGVSLTVRTRTEFDGFMWIEASVKNGSGKKLTSLKTVMPCIQRNAQFIHTPGRGWRGDAPPTDLTTDKPWVRALDGFSTLVWLGGHERGIQWMTEGRGGWFNRDTSDEVCVRPDGNRVTLAVKMIDSPCDREAFDFAFGLHPTPVKPPVARSKRLGTVGVWGVVPTLPRPSPKTGKDEKDFWTADRKRRAADPDFFKYSFLNSVASYYADGEAIRERAWYKSEWEHVPGYERLDPLAWSYFKTCPDTSYADWWVWFIKNRWLHPDYGNMAGIYFDHGSPVYCSHPLHGGTCGYPDEHGVVQPDYKIVATRNLLKRIYMAVKGIDREHPQGATPDYAVVLHTSTKVIAPHASFAFLFDGETWKVPGSRFMDRLTLAFMAAEWSPTAWGYDERGTCFKEAYYWQGFDPEARRELNDLFQSFHRTGRRPERLADLQAHPRYAEAVAWALPRTRECNAMFLLFDRTAQDPALSYFLGYDDYRAGLERMFDAFGFYQDDVVFKGYWRTGEWINGQTDTLKTSAYLRKPAGKTLLLTTNLDDDPVSTQLVVDAAALGLDGSIGWTCAETGKAIRTVPSADGRTAIHVDIPGRNYIAVLGERLDMGDGSNRE